jgi:hypothetical protein
MNFVFFLLETSPIAKNRKRTRKVLHPIATDTEIESSPSLSTDSACASPARRARLLNPGMSFTCCLHYSITDFF